VFVFVDVFEVDAEEGVGEETGYGGVREGWVDDENNDDGEKD
jgi:hypothetical protein